ncbi:hypothetical protein NBRC111894_1322 [Sporolactobacillus inulinus]|uniref:Uncharacterized protein n=1 Tax=Sporolactobacillus inulinus TaxID=2078 RepID=A0A4Y1ZAI9_9BACL|nr:hypothetical protein NBRC111894_1322 [Sporolactobacillus inulinus]
MGPIFWGIVSSLIGFLFRFTDQFLLYTNVQGTNDSFCNHCRELPFSIATNH